MFLDRVKKFKPSCRTCPLHYEKPVPSVGPAPRSFLSGVILLGEAPGEQEVQKNTPFVGAAGNMLNRFLSHAGLSREACWLVNTISCRPPKNKIFPEPIEACSKALEREIEFLKSCGGVVLVALGQTALDASGLSGSITNRRGYVYTSRFGIPVIPTFHPSYICRGSFEQAPVVIADLKKALTLARQIQSGTPWEEPKFDMNLFPSVQDVEALADRIDGNSLLGIDIETTALVPYKGEIVMIGIAESPTKALVVPFLSQGWKPYWSSKEAPRVQEAVRHILATAQTVFHNASFDMSFLTYKGFPVENLAHDTILLQHVINPESFLRLSYVASIYDMIPYWKNTLEDKISASKDLPDKEFRTYNAWDAIVLLRILPDMIADAKALGVYETYQNISLRLIRPVQAMYEAGVKLNWDRLYSWRKETEKTLQDYERAIRSRLSLPEEFNLSSIPHLLWLLYGKRSESVQTKLQDYRIRLKAIAKLEEEGRIPQATKFRSTKIFKELESLSRVFEETASFSLPPKAPRSRTTTGQISIDESSIESLLIWTRTEKEKSTKSSSSKSRSGRGIEDLEFFLETLLLYRARSKLLSTYGSFATSPDGRVHFPYKIAGTATGRLSSGDKKNLDVGNAQNIPEEIRKVFIAEDGHILIGADYASLEPRMLAYLSKDDKLIEDFAKGIKIYDSIIQETLQVPKTDPLYDSIRKAIKIYVLGTNYGGSLRTVYRQMKLKCKDLPLSFKDLEFIHKRRMELHPAYTEYYENLVRTVRTERVLVNAFGRRRVFLGDDHSIIREALDFGPQSSGADLMNQAMIRIHDRIHKESIPARIIIQLHDALYLESALSCAEEAARILVEEMERPVQIGSYKNVIFPVELKVGFSWGDMEEVSLSELRNWIQKGGSHG